MSRVLALALALLLAAPAVMCDPTTVVEGDIIDAVAPAGGFVYFVLPTISAGAASVTVSVTPFSGDPDLFVSQNDTQPGPGNSTWTAMRQGGDDITIPVGALDLSKPLYIGVKGYGSTDASFTLAVYRSALTVRPGSPQSGTVGANQDNLFKFPYSSDTDHVTVVLSAEFFYGLRLYINGIPAATEIASYPAGPDYQPRQWESNYDFPRRAIIRRGDVGFCGATSAGTNPPANTTCNLFITVHGSSYMTNATVFSVTASTAADVVRLQPGESMYDIVPASSYDYFTVTIGVAADVFFSLTALSGNPNLFISTSVPRPSAADGQYTWKSDFYGTDAIEISATDPNFKLGTYYIAVGGSANSYFLLEVGYANASTTLYPGTPVVDHLNAGQYRHFELPLQMSTPGPITISVASLNGTTPVLDVNVAADGFPVGVGSGTWSDYGFNGLSTVDLRPTDGKYCNRCVLYITVREISARVMDFTVVATVGSYDTVLLDGVPQVGKLAAGQWAYYMFTLNLAQAVNVQVTRTSGDPDIYVSRVDRRPSYNATWVANDVGSDAVQILTSDPNFCSRCDYFVGVYAFEESEYTVLAYHSNTTTSVRPGVPYEVTNASAGSFAYFDINVADTSAGITFTTTPTTGYPYMYVSTAGIPDPATPEFPAMWSASGYPASVTIPAGDANRCSNCRYYVAIGSRFSATSYTFQVRIGNAAQELAMGTPFYGDIPTRGFAYFFCRFPNPASPGNIEVTSFAGDPDIFVSRNVTAPTDAPGSYTWSGTNFGTDLVVIPAADIAACPGCNYYIGVQNYHDTRLRFTITASQRGEIMTLFEGTPQQDTLARNQTRRIVLTVNQAGRVTVTLSSEVGVPSVFMTSREPNGLAEWPTPSNRTSYQWSSAVGNPVVIVAARGDVGFCTSSPCKYYLTVMSRDPASTAGLRYTIAASAGDQQVTLQLRRPQIDNVQPQRFRYYVFYPEDVNAPLMVSVTALAGDPDLYVSRSVSQPNSGAGNYTWKGDRSGDDTIVINPRSDTRACQAADASSCVYYISVKNYLWSTSASYTVLVTQPGRFIELLNGVPQDGYVTKDATEMALFSIAVPDSINDRFQITVTPRRGIPDLFVGTLPVPINRANSSTYQWSSTHGLPVMVTIHPDHSSFCSGCRYYIGVAAGANSTDAVAFSILAAASNTTTTLRPGRSQIASVAPGSVAYFQASFPDRTSDVHISVTPLAGRSEDPDVLVSCASVNPRPDWSNSTWMGTLVGADEVVIRASDPGFCQDGDVFVIGITDIVESNLRETVSFIVTVFQTEGFSILQDGQPMAASLPTRSSQRHYQLYVNGHSAVAGIETVTFTVTPSYGSPVVCVATSLTHPTYEEDEAFPDCSNSTTYDLSSSYLQPSVVISLRNGSENSGAFFCTDCYYFVTVSAANPANVNQTSVAYTITAATSQATTTLQTGVPTQARVRPGDDTRFVFPIAKIDADIAVSVTLDAGDADMYASFLGGSSSAPTDSSLSWSLFSLSQEGTLVIPKDEALAACTELCSLAIVIVGAPWPNSTSVAPIDFVITASLASDVLSLTPGVPLTASMSSSSLRRFRLIVPANPQYLTVSVTADSLVELSVARNATGSGAMPVPLAVSPRATVTHVSLAPSVLAGSQVLFVTVNATTAIANSSVTVLAAFADSTIQLQVGSAGFTTIRAGTLMRFVADFGQNADVDNIIALQAFNGSAIALATYAPLDPLLDTKWKQAVSYDPKDPALAFQEITIAPDSAACKEALGAKRTCNLISIDVKAIQDADISLTPMRPNGSPVRIYLDRSQVTRARANVWSVLRLDPFSEKREVFLEILKLMSSTFFLVSTKGHPPAHNVVEFRKDEELLSRNYKRLTTTSKVPIQIEANLPLYVYIGSLVNENEGTEFIVYGSKSEIVQPTPSSDDGKKKGKKINSVITALIIVGAVLALVAMVGCFIFFTRFNTIRRMYKTSAGKGSFSEVALG